MFDDVLRKLHELQRRAQRIDGQHQISFDELFPDEFMLRNTEFPSVDEFISASGFTVESADDFAAIPDDPWDDYVRQRTRFASWAEMQQAAAEEWITRQLKL